MYYPLFFVLCLAQTRGDLLLELRMDNDEHKLHITETKSLKQDPNEPVYTLGALRFQAHNCPFYLGNAYLISTSFWSNVISTSTFKAYRCSRTTETWTRVYNQNKPLEWNIVKTSSRLSHAACKYMATYSASPNGDPLQSTNQTHSRTQNHFVFNTTLLHASNNWTHNVTNYFLQETHLTYDSLRNLIQSPDTTELEPCSYSSGVCYDSHFTTIWNVYNNQSCEIQQFRADSCYVTREYVYCPSLSITIGDYQKTKADLCGADLGIIRALLQDDDTTDNNLHLNSTAKYRVNIDFSNLYENIKIRHTQHLKLFHVTSCGAVPALAKLPKNVLRHANSRNPDAEWIDPGLMDRPQDGKFTEDDFDDNEL
jgi:hypothetical protein